MNSQYDSVITSPSAVSVPSTCLRDLIVPVKGVYFKQIRDGVKPTEFRLTTDYWTKRLVGRTYRNVVMLWGYPAGGGLEGLTRLTRKWRGYTRETLTHPHFGPDPVEVFAIDVSQQVESIETAQSSIHPASDQKTPTKDQS
jgi:hypothetical protein